MTLPLPQSLHFPNRRPLNPAINFQPHANWAKLEDHHRLRDTAKHWDAFDTTKLSKMDTRYYELEDRGRRLRQNIDLNMYEYRDNGRKWPSHPLTKKDPNEKNPLVSDENELRNAAGELIRPLGGENCDLCAELQDSRMTRAAQASLGHQHHHQHHDHQDHNHNQRGEELGKNYEGFEISQQQQKDEGE